LKRKKPARQKEELYHNVYVVLLKDAVTKHPSIVRLNPKRDPLKPCVYWDEQEFRSIIDSKSQKRLQISLGCQEIRA